MSRLLLPLLWPQEVALGREGGCRDTRGCDGPVCWPRPSLPPLLQRSPLPSGPSGPSGPSEPALGVTQPADPGCHHKGRFSVIVVLAFTVSEDGVARAPA